jgi:catechol 2,3-dioxygenase-like lactoylglutathione lyase family enzyme
MEESRMLDKAQAEARPKPLRQLPLRLHHQAFAVRDQEATRRFMEEVLGIPLVATWCERVYRAEVGREVDYCHTFYALDDGGAIAFFQFADDEAWEKNRLALQPSGGSLHSAFKVTQQTYDELVRRLEATSTPHRTIDHGYCLSLYVNSPDGFRFEFVIDAPEADEIAAMRRADAHSELARWLAGDRRPNNDDRPH